MRAARFTDKFGGMTAINRTILLPDGLVEQAEAAGLLSPEELGRLVQEEVLRRAAFDELLKRKVQEALDDPRPSIPQEEVFAELRRHHAKRIGA